MSRSDRRTRLDELDQEIPQLELKLKELERERKEIFTSLTFPVLTLPVEVTSEVFMRCLPARLLYMPLSSDAPRLLTRICRQWREIAISMPRLWSTFLFPADAPQSEARDYFINYWLTRSRQTPLSIDLYSGYVEANDLGAHERAISKSIQTCLDRVGKYSSRWRDVRLRLKPSVLQHSSISVPAEGFPLLESLTIGRDHGVGSDSHFGDGSIDFFATAPRLRSVEIVLDIGGDIDIRLFTLPWSQLASFTGTAFCASECFFVLKQTPVLLECIFLRCQPGSDNVQDIPPLAPMTVLKSLSVETSYSLSGFLGALRLPGLERLSARLRGTGVIANTSLLVQLVTRSGCTLRHFTYSGMTESAHIGLLDCLTHMPRLLSLELPNPQPDASYALCAAIFERLREDLELVPELQSLAILPSDVIASFPFDSLLAMLQARSRPERPKPLRHFELRGTQYDWF